MSCTLVGQVLEKKCRKQIKKLFCEVVVEYLFDTIDIDPFFDSMFFTELVYNSFELLQQICAASPCQFLK